jgi:hypothetical protein
LTLSGGGGVTWKTGKQKTKNRDAQCTPADSQVEFES